MRPKCQPFRIRPAFVGKRSAVTRRFQKNVPAMAIELVVRTAACTSALILAVTLARARRASIASRVFGGLLCLGVASYLACSGSHPGCSASWA
jgi:hypothetical protein